MAHAALNNAAIQRRLSKGVPPCSYESAMSNHSDQVLNDIAGRYFLVLGAAAADLWSELPQELQQQLFERAVLLGHQGEQDESLREQLAKFLHDHHERTAQALPGR
jgi:glucose-6-phosphate-specific signal transduction histidine kinase